MIAPLLCISCNSPLAIVDAPTVACSYCGTINPIPEEHREALRLARDLDEATRAAIREWARLNKISVPRWLFVVTSTAPFVLMAGGLVLILVDGLLRPESRSDLPLLLGVGVWLPLVPVEALAARICMMSILVSGAARIGVAFAAAPPAAEGAPPGCRQCGAPLSVRPDDLLVRCVYCETESIVILDSAALSDFKSRIGSARTSLAQAMAAMAKRVKLIRIQTWGRTAVVFGFLILPLIWSFNASGIQSNRWSLLIAVDAWMLCICLFWNAREAFLPPVTIEELDAIVYGTGVSEGEEASSKEPVPPVSGTRGWYDHSSEKRNFVVPTIVALMFFAVELLVLNG